MVEARLTPTHAHAFAALLDEPFTSAFHHTAAYGQPQCFIGGIVNMIAMTFEIFIDFHEGLSCVIWQRFYFQGLGQIAQDTIGGAVTQAMPSPAKPPAGLCRSTVAPGCRSFPHVLRRMVKIQNAPGMGSEALVIETPQPPTAITEPDHLRGAQEPLAQRCEPQPWLEGIDIAPNCHQTARIKPRDALPGTCAMLAQTGQYPHFDLMPSRFASRLAGLRPKRHHDPIGAYGTGRDSQVGLQSLGHRLLTSRHLIQLCLELCDCPFASGLHPSPHRPRADGGRTIPAEQPCRGGKRHKDGQGTTQVLELSAASLMGLHPQGFI